MGIRTNQRGFSLLEVMLSLGFLMTIILGVTEMLKSSFDMKAGLSQKSRVLHRMNIAMTKLTNDLQHVYIVSSNDQDRNGIGRTTKAYFKMDPRENKIEMTTKTNEPLRAGMNQSDETVIIYELVESRTASGRTDLTRANTGVVPLEKVDNPNQQVIAKHIKSLELEWWQGDKWSKDRFDSNSRETRNKLPRMVRVTLEAWLFDREDQDGQTEEADQATESIQTVVFLPESLAFEEVKEPFKTIKWNDF